MVRPVPDVAGQEPVDAYDVPDPMRVAVVQSPVFEIFPWGTADARHCRVDHTGTTPLGRERPEILRQREQLTVSRCGTVSGTGSRSDLEARVGRLLVDVA